MTSRRTSTKRINAIIETSNISASNHLSQAPIFGISDFYEIAVEEDEIGTVHGGCLGLAHEFHDDRAGYLAVLVNVHGTFLIAEEKFGVRETEHAQRLLVRQSRRNVRYGRIFGVGYAHWNFLVERHEFEAFEGGDGDVSMEEIYCEAFGWDIKLVEFAEEFCDAPKFLAEETGLFLRRLLEDRFEDFES